MYKIVEKWFKRNGIYSQKKVDEAVLMIKNGVVFLLVLSVLIGTVCFIPR